MITALFSAAFASAQPATNVAVGLSNWRVGFSVNARHGLYTPMFVRKDSLMFQGTGLKTQGEVNVSPSYFRGGGHLTFSPLSILDLSGYGMYDLYYGNLQTIVDYDNANEDYGSNAVIAEYVDATGRQSPGKGWHFGGAVTLKIKVGPLIALSKSDYSLWDIQIGESEGAYFFEREKELMMAFDGDRLFEENGLLLLEFPLQRNRGNVRVGSITTYRQTVEGNDTMLRTGMIVMANLPTGFSHNLIVQPYLKDRAFSHAFPPFTAYQLRFAR